MNKITDRKSVNSLVLLLMITYTISYLTRINYGAVISEIVTAEHITKAAASIALTGSAVTYGAGQLISGYMGDRIQPKKLVLAGLITTILMNLVIPLCKTTIQTTAAWCVNGLAQAFMWPPMVKIMSTLLNSDDYKKTTAKVGWGSSIGTMAVYLLSPICIHFFGWHSVFILSAFCAIVMAVVWQKKCPSIEANSSENFKTNGKFPFSIVILILLVVIALQGALRDGVTTWMPSFVAESFNLSNEISILTGIILPIFSIITSYITSQISRKLIKNELILGGTMFGIGCLSALALALFGSGNVVTSLLFAALLSGCVHGVNYTVTCLCPPNFSKYGCVSFASGLLNSGTYIGSAISTYGIAVFADNFGWGSTLWLWTALAAIGTLLCFSITEKWKQFKD